MRDKAQDAAQMAIKRRVFLEKGFELFSEKTIESVSMQDVADASGYGVATLYRYFNTKAVFVIAVATWKWERYREENKKRRSVAGYDNMTAAQEFEFYLDSYLELYRNNRELLRFNQFFNIYIQSEKVTPEVMKPYQDMIRNLAENFHKIYEKAEVDQTLRTDIPEKEIFSATLHLMLAAVTRYAVGLVWRPDGTFDAEKELEVLKDLLFRKYRSI